MEGSSINGMGVGLDISGSGEGHKWRTLLNIAMYLRVTENEGNFLNVFGTINISRRILRCAVS